MSRRWRAPRTTLVVLIALVSVAASWLAFNKRSHPATGAGSGAVGTSSVSYGRWGDGLAFAVWADTNWQYDAADGSSARQARYNGFVTAQTGERLDWSCQVYGAGRGEVVFNGVQFDLADGSLFLVSVHSGTVRQLQRDLSGLAPDLATLEALSREDADVRAFVATASPPRLGRWLPAPVPLNRMSLGPTINRPLS